jgi:hypothetical protein
MTAGDQGRRFAVIAVGGGPIASTSSGVLIAISEVSGIVPEKAIYVTGNLL